MELVCDAHHILKPQSFILIKDLTFLAGFDTIVVENEKRFHSVNPKKEENYGNE
jgi:hypothetical protein